VILPIDAWYGHKFELSEWFLIRSYYYTVHDIILRWMQNTSVREKWLC